MTSPCRQRRNIDVWFPTLAKNYEHDWRWFLAICKLRKRDQKKKKHQKIYKSPAVEPWSTTTWTAPWSTWIFRVDPAMAATWAMANMPWICGLWMLLVARPKDMTIWIWPTWRIACKICKCLVESKQVSKQTSVASVAFLDQHGVLSHKFLCVSPCHTSRLLEMGTTPGFCRTKNINSRLCRTKNVKCLRGARCTHQKSWFRDHTSWFQSPCSNLF